jgi:hypothetical protein
MILKLYVTALLLSVVGALAAIPFSLKVAMYFVICLAFIGFVVPLAISVAALWEEGTTEETRGGETNENVRH